MGRAFLEKYMKIQMQANGNNYGRKIGSNKR